MYISLVIQRLFAILLDEERSLIRIDGFHADIAEVDIAGMVHPEAFGRQDAPHGLAGRMPHMVASGYS